jgi:two-component system chemotaxis sensor kinase CheA
MELVFDISDDEMPIFLAETEDQLQVLEEGLVRIEHEPEDIDLIQGLFRAAHTLKGMAGMIGHKRLVSLTHALENGFDGIRKNTYPVSTEFIDLCLESIDSLRLLREEVIDRQESDVDVETTVEKIETYIHKVSQSDAGNILPPPVQKSTPHPVPAAEQIPEPKPEPKAEVPQPVAEETKPAEPTPEPVKQPEKPAGMVVLLEAEISPTSIASAARAFQLMMALQASGTILDMEPDQETIETSKPVKKFFAKFIPNQPLDVIRQDLRNISEVDNVTLIEQGTTGGESTPKEDEKPAENSIVVEVDISPKSVASAARAFQIMMCLQSSGTVLEMNPSQEQIETSKPVPHFKAKFVPTKPLDSIRQELTSISEIDRLVLGDAVIELVQPKSSSPVQSGEKVNTEPPRLGDFLVENGTISTKQLQTALSKQKELTAQGHQALLGQVVIDLGYCDRETLDQATAKYMQTQRAALQAAQEADKNKEKAVDKTVRTSVERLDALMNLVGELITDRNRLYQLRNKLETTYRGNDEVSMLSDTVVHIGRITDQLQEEVMHIRMQPVANVFNKFPRMVRDLAQKTGKELDLILRGQETELDRSVIEEINDPLIHLLRNSVDHGIETPGERRAAGKNPRGTVILSARHEQGRIVLTVEDDGKGIDLDKLKKSAVNKGMISEAEAAVMPDDKAIDLIFASGVSTAKTVSDISGRGVGMDIVRNNIERLNGTILVDTHPGHGSTFTISLPLTLAIVPTLLVKVSGTTFAIPLVMVIETQRLEKKNISIVSGRPVTKLRDQIISLLELSDAFHLDQAKDGHDKFMVVVRSSKVEVGLVVDSLVGEEEVVVKSLSSLVGDTLGISSAAILGDGQVALILDVPGLYKLAGLH